MAAPKKDDKKQPQKTTMTGKKEAAKKAPAAPMKQNTIKPAAKPKK